VKVPSILLLLIIGYSVPSWSKGYRPIIRHTGESRDVCDKSDEYLFAEIEARRLFIVLRDNSVRATNPEKQIVFCQIGNVERA